MNQTRQQHGSVYVMTLITIATISAMILVGISLRSSNNAKASLVEGMSTSSNATLDATELTLQTVASDAEWKATAQTGVALPKQTINGVTYASTVKDADTDTTPTETTTNYTLTMSATQNSIEHVSQLTFEYASVDYPTLVDAYKGLFYWPLSEDPKSTTAVDAIDACDGTYQDPNAAGATTNDHGAQVPLFTGSSDHIDIPWTNKFKETHGAFSLWVNSTGTTNFQSYGILGMQYASGGSPNLSLVVVNNAIGAYLSDSGSFNFSNVAVTPTVLTPGTWHHVAMTWGPGGLIIYVDGIQAGENYGNTSGLDTGRSNQGGEQPLHIGGGYTIGYTKQPFVGFEGSIAHVVFYKNHQLTADEVAEIAAVHPDEATFALIPDTWVTVYPE